MFTTAYITTRDYEGHMHNYRLTPREAAQGNWVGKIRVKSREAGLFKFSDIISDESAKLLWTATH